MKENVRKAKEKEKETKKKKIGINVLPGKRNERCREKQKKRGEIQEGK